mgnify:CR=1 FL=1
MKTMKKILSLVMGLVMALAMSVTAFAAGGTYSITIENPAPDHIYEAYQIFAGDLTMKDGNKVLSNITWGSGVDTANLPENLKDAAAVAEKLSKGEMTAAEFAKTVAPYLKADGVKTSNAVAGGYTISGLDAGYYLVKDQDNSLNNADDFYTAYIMEVVGDVTAKPKGDKPSLNKQIKDNDKGTWGVVGDNQIGDTVEFRTISTVPNTEGYTKYDYIISDTMSDGLTSNVKTADDVNITVNGKVLPRDYYDVTENGNSFQVHINILGAIADGYMTAGAEIITSYTGVLNGTAKVYDEGKQDNTAHLEYSNNPNNTENRGQTPDSKVYDWTFKMDVNKVDKNQKPLEGAKFVLSKNGSLNVADMECGEDGVPTKTENLIGLITDVDGNYVVATVDANKADIVYAIDAGYATIKGLDDVMDYYLYETKAPEGYNLLSQPVQFKINAEYETDGSQLKAGYPTVTVDGKVADTMSFNVVNQSGAELPSTGGIGTTIFYVVGGLLVVGAGIVLVTKKRMGKAE